ncbi:hypothetical protein MRX96_000642 [Rhipicephalus microplus]
MNSNQLAQQAILLQYYRAESSTKPLLSPSTPTSPEDTAVRRGSSARRVNAETRSRAPSRLAAEVGFMDHSTDLQ